MKLSDKAKGVLLFSALYVSLVTCITGSIFGTYAWYQYSSRAGIIYDGTAVSDAGGTMEVGLYSEKSLASFAARNELVEDTISLAPGYVYWSRAGLTSTLLMDYAKTMGYASMEISSVSSGSFKSGDKLHLKKAPYYLDHIETQDAREDFYTYIPAVFKAASGTGVSMNIKISKVEFECESRIKSSLRLGFNQPEVENSSLLFAPGQAEDGEVYVGGPLNLNNDLYYDFIDGFERIYGEYTYVRYSDAGYEGPNTVDRSQIDTFHANHYQNVRYIKAITAKTAEYVGVKNIPNKVLAYTDPAKGIARLDITVYSEGWDENVVDAEERSKYDLNLEFKYEARE